MNFWLNLKLIEMQGEKTQTAFSSNIDLISAGSIKATALLRSWEVALRDLAWFLSSWELMCKRSLDSFLEHILSHLLSEHGLILDDLTNLLLEEAFLSDRASWLIDDELLDWI